MLYYFYLLSLLVLAIVFLLFRYAILRKKNISLLFFIEARKNENEGHFEEAIMNYENGLSEVNKTRFHNNMKNKIIAKLKVLHTMIEYKNSLLFIR